MTLLNRTRRTAMPLNIWRKLFLHSHGCGKTCLLQFKKCRLNCFVQCWRLAFLLVLT